MPKFLLSLCPISQIYALLVCLLCQCFYASTQYPFIQYPYIHLYLSLSAFYVYPFMPPPKLLNERSRLESLDLLTTLIQAVVSGSLIWLSDWPIVCNKTRFGSHTWDPCSNDDLGVKFVWWLCTSVATSLETSPSKQRHWPRHNILQWFWRSKAFILAMLLADAEWWTRVRDTYSSTGLLDRAAR
jgi:hypothetical protein